jgi:uncharacterized protein (DUF486 family)
MNFLLDFKNWTMERRAIVAIAVCYCYALIIWGWGGYLQYHMDYTKEDPPRLDISNSEAIEPLFLMIFWGFCDAFIQLWSYWVLRQMTNDVNELSRFAGFYKFWQNVGALVAYVVFGVVIQENVLKIEYWTNMGILIATIPPTCFGIYGVIKAHLRPSDIEISSRKRMQEMEKESEKDLEAGKIPNIADETTTDEEALPEVEKSEETAPVQALAVPVDLRKNSLLSNDGSQNLYKTPRSPSICSAESRDSLESIPLTSHGFALQDPLKVEEV